MNRKDFKEGWANRLVLASPSMRKALGSIPSTEEKQFTRRKLRMFRAWD